MSLSRDSRAEKKLKAFRRAEFALKQKFERIDWEEDVLYPEVEQLKAGHPVLGLPEGSVFDLQVVNEDEEEEEGEAEDEEPSSLLSRLVGK